MVALDTWPRMVDSVCNVCTNRRKCKMDRAYYIAQQADAMAKRRYAEARSKTQIQSKEMAALDTLVTPLIVC